MANTKAEIVDAAVAAGVGDRADLEAMTKTEILTLMGV